MRQLEFCYILHIAHILLLTAIIILQLNLYKMCSNYEIENEMKNYPNFRGCFPINKLPKIKFPMSLIINSDNENEEGTHWMALKFLKNKKVLYFDSFGEEPPEEILNYVKKSGKLIIFSNLQIQSIFSDKCGQFCMSFIKNVNSKSSFEHFLSVFDKNNLLYNIMMC